MRAKTFASSISTSCWRKFRFMFRELAEKKILRHHKNLQGKAREEVGKCMRKLLIHLLPRVEKFSYSAFVFKLPWEMNLWEQEARVRKHKRQVCDFLRHFSWMSSCDVFTRPRTKYEDVSWKMASTRSFRCNDSSASHAPSFAWTNSRRQLFLGESFLGICIKSTRRREAALLTWL